MILGRPLPHDFDHYNREELLYELDMALQENADLLQQLAGKHCFASSALQSEETRARFPPLARRSRKRKVANVSMSLTDKSPNITELHNQTIAVRKEVARQKYLNRFLWRKLEALMDIQGSQSRADLLIELANYQEEVESLRSKQHRPISRSSSSGVCRVIVVFALRPTNAS